MQSGTKSDAIMEGHTADQWSELSDRDLCPATYGKNILE